MDAKSGEKLSIYNPHDESLVTDDVHVAGQADVDAAVAAARAAFKGEWSTWKPAQRSAVMLKLADLIDKNASDLAPLEAKAMGQPIPVVMMLLAMTSSTFRYYAGWTDKIMGEQMPETDGIYTIVSYEPVGVCAGIGAWNGSAIFFAFKIAAAVVRDIDIFFSYDKNIFRD